MNKVVYTIRGTIIRYIYIYISLNYCYDHVYNFNTVLFYWIFLNNILPLKLKENINFLEQLVSFMNDR